MEAITEILIQKGITGVFILLLVYAISMIYKQAMETRQKHLDDMAKKDRESNELEREFRQYLSDSNTMLMRVIEEHNDIMREFNKNSMRSSIVFEQLMKAIERNKLKV